MAVFCGCGGKDCLGGLEMGSNTLVLSAVLLMSLLYSAAA